MAGRVVTGSNSGSTVDVSQDLLSVLPCFEYKASHVFSHEAEGDEDEGDSCCICLECYDIGDQVSALHASFHHSLSVRWLSLAQHRPWL